MEAQQNPAASVAEDVVDDVAPDAVDQASTPVGRTVRSIGHGSTVAPVGDATDASQDPATSNAPLLPAAQAAVYRDLREHRYDSTTAFDYLFPELAASFPNAHLAVGNGTTATVVEHLKALGTAMVSPPPAPPGGGPAVRNSHVPAVYTYWGQFIDHDITLNTNGPDDDAGSGGDLALGDVDRVPFRVFDPKVVVRSLRNARHPALDLDSLYGSGPKFEDEPDHGTTRSEAAFVEGSAKLRLGRIPVEPFSVPGGGPTFLLCPPEHDQQRDLPRGDDRGPLIPDGRNDENLVVAQFHVAMIRFHNAVVDWVAELEPWVRASGERGVYRRANQLVRWHYQWLVVNDYLRTLTKPGVLDAALLGDSPFFRPRHPIAMPLEFAVAAFRFGHSMVRESYDFNVNFTAGGPAGLATLEQLFRFTGGGGLTQGGPPNPVLPSNWPIDWTKFVDKGDANPFHAAEKIDTFLAPSLGTMVKEGKIDLEPGQTPTTAQTVASALQKQLAQRNLLRGYMLGLPTGEAVARAFGLEPLSPQRLVENAPQGVVDAMGKVREVGGGTPLWYYVLKEAELQGNGSFLGDVGSRILAETFVHLLRQDDRSYLRATHHWTPAQGVHFEDGSLVLTLPDLLRFAGVLPDAAGAFRGGGTAGHDGA
ncbi:peroxidase family protein [Cellulosimicrobium marinum]|uniref:peroxidase family protein n=1 Tax=Cellulosimicrobium marinum TaxID=1638992 RepID=UPI001E3B9C89|nr:heme peroxidase family protein [Cellulosimicrobium marinum]MCB7137715.1 heme peroxidase family protein [Cellulosimicrobium marinum]